MVSVVGGAEVWGSVVVSVVGGVVVCVQGRGG